MHLISVHSSVAGTLHVQAYVLVWRRTGGTVVTFSEREPQRYNRIADDWFSVPLNYRLC